MRDEQVVGRVAEPAGPEKSGLLAERIRSAIAIFIVVFGLAVIFASYAVRGVEDMNKVASVFLGVVGIVTGYYFGRSGVDSAEQAAKQATKEKQAIEQASEDLPEFRDQIRDFQQVAQDYQKLLDAIAKDPGVKAKLEALGL